MNHELFTQMLFVDATVGVGFPNDSVGHHAFLGELAHYQDGEYVWNRTALEALPLETLQELYTGLKLHEVTHAH